MLKTIISATVSVLLASQAVAQSSRDVVLSSPSVDQLADLLDHPEQWQTARERISTILFFESNISQMPDDALRADFSKMRSLSLNVELEVAALKVWTGTPDHTFRTQNIMWKHLLGLGAPLQSIAMDEPLEAALGPMKLSEEDAANRTADFVILTRHAYPNLKIGDVEPFPAVPLSTHRSWILMLQDRLTRANSGHLDFYRVDVDWIAFQKTREGSWKDVRDLQAFVQSRHILFSLIYWASPFPYQRGAHVRDDKTWYNDVMEQAKSYAAVGGRPDQIVFENWVTRPQHVLPETADVSLMAMVRNVLQRYIPAR